jgi:hypothetical protein
MKPKNKCFYVKCGEKIYAAVYKAASASILYSIAEKHYKNVLHEPRIKKEDFDLFRVHDVIPKFEKSLILGSQVVLISRDPVERFVSACAEMEITPSRALKSLGKDNMNHHFVPTSNWLVDGCRLYKFEEHLQDIVKDLDLTWPMVKISGKKIEKPKLKEVQIKKIERFYAEDVALHKSIKKAGQIWTASKTPSVEDILKFR